MVICIWALARKAVLYVRRKRKYERNGENGVIVFFLRLCLFLRRCVDRANWDNNSISISTKAKTEKKLFYLSAVLPFFLVCPGTLLDVWGKRERANKISFSTFSRPKYLRAWNKLCFFRLDGGHVTSIFLSFVRYFAVKISQKLDVRMIPVCQVVLVLTVRKTIPVLKLVSSMGIL